MWLYVALGYLNRNLLVCELLNVVFGTIFGFRGAKIGADGGGAQSASISVAEGIAEVFCYLGDAPGKYGVFVFRFFLHHLKVHIAKSFEITFEGKLRTWCCGFFLSGAAFLAQGFVFFQSVYLHLTELVEGYGFGVDIFRRALVIIIDLVAKVCYLFIRRFVGAELFFDGKKRVFFVGVVANDSGTGPGTCAEFFEVVSLEVNLGDEFGMTVFQSGRIKCINIVHNESFELIEPFNGFLYGFTMSFEERWEVGQADAENG